MAGSLVIAAETKVLHPAYGLFRVQVLMKQSPLAILTVLALQFCCADAHAKPSVLPPGKPLVQNWSMADYGGQVTNWAIEQAPDGRMLVGNGNYLLIFDGARWRQIDTPQGDRVRVMAIGPEGRVWVGM